MLTYSFPLRTQSAVDQYIHDVLKMYASTFVRDTILGRCVKAVTNERLVKVSMLVFLCLTRNLLYFALFLIDQHLGKMH